MSPISPPATVALSGSMGWVLAARTSSDTGAVVAFFVLGGVFLVLVWTAVFVWARVRSDRELPVRLTTPTVVGSHAATRFKGGALFAVDGQRRSGSYPLGELVLDGTEAIIRVRQGPGRFPKGTWQRTIRQEEVQTVLVSRWRPVRYVEFVDDVRTHGRTRFSGGPNVVRALRDRGWPVLDERARQTSSDVGGTSDRPPTAR